MGDGGNDPVVGSAAGLDEQIVAVLPRTAIPAPGGTGGGELTEPGSADRGVGGVGVVDQEPEVPERAQGPASPRLGAVRGVIRGLVGQGAVVDRDRVVGRQALLTGVKSAELDVGSRRRAVGGE